VEQVNAMPRQADLAPQTKGQELGQIHGDSPALSGSRILVYAK
jgi:hypothetical protein